jgi:hypothetical protein
MRMPARVSPIILNVRNAKTKEDIISCIQAVQALQRDMPLHNPSPTGSTTAVIALLNDAIFREGFFGTSERKEIDFTRVSAAADRLQILMDDWQKVKKLSEKSFASK